MSDHLLNNLRDLIGGTVGKSSFDITFSAHGVDESAAAEVVAHLTDDWTWTPNAYGHATEWLTGIHTSGIKVVLFLPTPKIDALNTARGRAVLERAEASS